MLSPQICAMMIPTISPYSAMASAKIIMRIMGTYICSFMALERTPTSPTMPTPSSQAMVR